MERPGSKIIKIYWKRIPCNDNRGYHCLNYFIINLADTKTLIRRALKSNLVHYLTDSCLFTFRRYLHEKNSIDKLLLMGSQRVVVNRIVATQQTQLGLVGRNRQNSDL